MADSGSAFSSLNFAISAILVTVLLLEAATNARQLRWIYGGLIYLVTILWYLVDPLYTPENYLKFTPAEVEDAFGQVVLFLVAFRICMELFVRRTPTNQLLAFDPRHLDRPGVVRALLVAWLIIWLAGLALANFDVFNLMFPLKGRYAGVKMFARGRYGGSTGFLLSAASYIYLVLCSGFGLLLVCARKKNLKLVMLLMLLWTWPMFFLLGTRHLALAVAMPSIFAVLLTKHWSQGRKIAFTLACFIVINIAMLAAIQFRQSGGIGRAYAEGTFSDQVLEAKHVGLNMPQELMYINRYQRDGRLPIEWGNNYLGHVLNFIPRAIWPDKPFVGREFALLRTGIYRGDVAATISFGFIGQGVANFGAWMGPIAPAFLFSLLGIWVVQLPTGGFRSFRVLLVLFIFGSLPNLGRDISLFVLWPVVFAFSLVLLYERFAMPAPSTQAWPPHARAPLLPPRPSRR